MADNQNAATPPSNSQPAQPPNVAPPNHPPEHPPTVDNTALLTATRAAGSVGRRPRMNDLLNDNIVAKPLSMGEGFFNLRPKSPDVTFRGVNAVVQTKDGPNYLRYEQARSQGYVNVTVADIAGTVPPSFIRDNGQRIVNGDLILMKIASKDYRGAVKWKDMQAIRATQRGGIVEQGNAELRKAMDETGMPPRLARKLQPFSPTSSEFNKDFGTNDD